VTTIPVSFIANVIPSVIQAGGAALVLNGLMLTTSQRLPTGTVQGYGSAANVGTYFGLSSNEYLKAQQYFNSYLLASQYPGQILVAQFTPTDVPGWVRGGSIAGLTVPQVAALTGNISIAIGGGTYTATGLSLSSATSYSAAATLIQTALNTTLPTGFTSTATSGSIVAVSSTFQGSIAGNVLTVTSAPSNLLVRGAIITVGASVGTQITEQLTSTGAANGGVGTYAVSIYQSVPLGTNFTATYGTLTLSAPPASGTASIGMQISGTGVTAGTQLMQAGPGTAGQSFYVSPSQTVTNQTITGVWPPLTVTYDSISGGILITAGNVGAISTAAAATGSLATSLNLTTATGATVSQGAAGVTPGAFMPNIVSATQNWASFFTLYDPDDAGANTGQWASKVAFSSWATAQNNRYLYLGWDTDIQPTLQFSCTTSFAYAVGPNGTNSSGTMPIYDPNNTGKAAFVAGCIASINFGALNGRTTMAFRQQSGQVADVTTGTAYTNLLNNGYNFYGAYSTANQGYTFLYNGSVTGPYLWADSYVNQIYMNAAFQVDMISLMTTVPSIPYNTTGATMVETSLLPTINQMVNFGAVVPGISLSGNEIAAVNAIAGFDVSGILFNAGWYFQMQPAIPSTRRARTTPPIYFFYCDGGSIQQMTLNSVELQ